MSSCEAEIQPLAGVLDVLIQQKDVLLKELKGGETFDKPKLDQLALVAKLIEKSVEASNANTADLASSQKAGRDEVREFFAIMNERVEILVSQKLAALADEIADNLCHQCGQRIRSHCAAPETKAA